MADVTVTQPHTLSLDEVKNKMSEFETMMAKYGVKANWSGHSAKLKGLGVSGSIDVTDDQVKVLVKLGMMAKAAGVDPVRLKGSIERRLKAAFEG
ncbi:MAG: polyhydroxyalkanoic acid system family protein [Myxococcota bacterium]